MFTSARTIAFAVTFDPARTQPSSWNALCQAARRVAAAGHTLRMGAGPGGEQIVAEHALTAGGRVTLVLPWSGYEEAWVSQVRRWFPGRVSVELEEPAVDGQQSTLIRDCSFLVVLGAGVRWDTADRTEDFPACDRSVMLALGAAVEAGLPVFDLQEELASSWLDEALALPVRSHGTPRETSISTELPAAERVSDRHHPSFAHARARRAVPSLLRRSDRSLRPGSPGPRMAG